MLVLFLKKQTVEHNSVSRKTFGILLRRVKFWISQCKDDVLILSFAQATTISTTSLAIIVSLLLGAASFSPAVGPIFLLSSLLNSLFRWLSTGIKMSESLLFTMKKLYAFGIYLHDFQKFADDHFRSYLPIVVYKSRQVSPKFWNTRFTLLHLQMLYFSTSYAQPFIFIIASYGNL